MTDDGVTEREEGLVDVGAAFVTNAQAAELVQPTQRAFDHPASFTQTTAVRGAATGQLVGDAALLQPAMVSRTAVGTIALYRNGSLPRATDFAPHGGNGRYEWLQLAAVMHVSCRQLDAQRQSLGLGANMMLAARFAAIRRVGSRLTPPKTARTLLESTTARDQSIRSVACKRRSSSWWSFCQTPAFCQSRKRRQQVMPLPHPNSCGRSCHAMPLLSTNKIPVNAARSGTRGRPANLARRFFFGSSGWMIAHNESVTNGFAIPSFSQNCSKKYTSFCYTLLVMRCEKWPCPFRVVARP
jgi:hypothetical protein